MKSLFLGITLGVGSLALMTGCNNNMGTNGATPKPNGQHAEQHMNGEQNARDSQSYWDQQNQQMQKGQQQAQDHMNQQQKMLDDQMQQHGMQAPQGYSN